MGLFCRSFATLYLAMIALEGILQVEVEMQTPRGSMVGIYRERAMTLDSLATHKAVLEEDQQVCTYMIQLHSFER